MPVVVTSGGTSETVTVPGQGFVSDEYDGAAGAPVNLAATMAAGGGQPAATGQATCTPKASIVKTSEYGQVDAQVSGTQITLLCRDPNTWQ